MLISRSLCALGCLLVIAGGSGCNRDGEILMPAAADKVLYNGNIITVDAQDSIAAALAIKNGRILAVGSNETIRALAGPATKQIDLRGATATPGLLDAHAHFARGGASLLYELDLSSPEVGSVVAVVQKVESEAGKLETGQWLHGRGWDEGKLAERRYIYAADLDPVTPGNPVYLSHTMGHYGVANSLALRMAGIARNTPDPLGGTIDRGSDGEPTGILKESAQGLVMRLLPPIGVERMSNGVRRIVEGFNRECMTGVKDPAIDGVVWDAYKKVLEEGKLTVRVFTLWRSGGTLEAAQDLIRRIGPFSRPYLALGDKQLISGGIKLFADGSGGARTAWLYEDWNKNFEEFDEGNRGYPAIDPEILRQQIRMYHDAGLHMSTHAIGDRAIDWVVDSYAMVLKQKPTSGLRHGIIHNNIPSDRALGRHRGAAARIRRCLPRAVGALYVVDRRYLCGQFRAAS